MSSTTRPVVRLPMRIAGVGRHLPPTVVTNSDLEDELGLDPGWILRKTGIKSRRSAGRERPSVMMKHAALEALDRARLLPSQIDHVLCASAVPEQAIPSAAILLADGLAIRGAVCFDVNATCLSFLVAMNTAACLIAAGQARNVLLACAEIPRGSDALNKDDAESAVLFGDAAAAMVLTRDDTGARGIVKWQMRSYPEGKDLARLRAGAACLPHHAHWDDSAVRFEMDGKAIYKLAFRLGESFLADLWQDSVPAAELDAVLLHQTSAKAIALTTRRLGVPPERVCSNLEQLGNTVSASLPLCYYDGVARGLIHEGSKVLFLGTSAGISIGAMTLVA